MRSVGTCIVPGATAMGWAAARKRAGLDGAHVAGGALEAGCLGAAGLGWWLRSVDAWAWVPVRHWPWADARPHWGR